MASLSTQHCTQLQPLSYKESLQTQETEQIVYHKGHWLLHSQLFADGAAWQPSDICISAQNGWYQSAQAGGPSTGNVCLSSRQLMQAGSVSMAHPLLVCVCDQERGHCLAQAYTRCIGSLGQQFCSRLSCSHAASAALCIASASSKPSCSSSQNFALILH